MDAVISYIVSADMELRRRGDASDLGSQQVDFLPRKPGTRDHIPIQIPTEDLADVPRRDHLGRRDVRQLCHVAERVVLDLGLWGDFDDVS